MPSLVGDRGQVLEVLGWALTSLKQLTLTLKLGVTLVLTVTQVYVSLTSAVRLHRHLIYSTCYA